MELKISCLLFIRNIKNQLLSLKRSNSPNKGTWSPPGGKLNMPSGESPFECAKREALEETGLVLSDEDLYLFGYVSEKGYENDCHWLMFLFDCKKIISETTKAFEEGYFGFFDRADIDGLKIPQSDHQLVWPFYDSRLKGFCGIKADCSEPNNIKIKIESKP